MSIEREALELRVRGFDRLRGRQVVWQPAMRNCRLPPMLMFDQHRRDRRGRVEHYGKGPDPGCFRDQARSNGSSSAISKGDPVMPGCLGLDALWQLCGFYLGWLGLPGRVVARSASARSSSPTRCCRPSRRLIYGIDLKRVFRGKLVLGIADGWLEADGRRIYEAKDLRVGLVPEQRRGGLTGVALASRGRRPDVFERAAPSRGGSVVTRAPGGGRGSEKEI